MALQNMGVSRTFKEVDAALAVAVFPNSTVEQAVKKEVDRVKAEVVQPIVQGAQQSKKRVDQESGELAQEAAAHQKASRELRRKIKRHEISAKDARSQLDRLKREQIVLDDKRDALVKHYETETYIADHAEEYVGVLWERYPALPRPSFPI